MKHRSNGADDSSLHPRKRTKRQRSLADKKPDKNSSAQIFSLRKFQRSIVSYDDEDEDPANNTSARNFRIRYLVLTITLFVIVVGLVGASKSLCNAILTFFNDQVKTVPLIPPDPIQPQPPSWSKLKVFRRGAISLDSKECALIGRTIVERNGSAVDAAIASMICNSLINMQSMGFGGGFVMTIYRRASQEAVILNARECAPRAANTKVYDDLPALASQIGPMAIPVPGELAGYWEAHRRFGLLPWADLFQPSIKICEAGYKLTKNQYDSLSMNKESIYTDPTLRSWFVDENTSNFRKPGTIVHPTKLCETMRRVGEFGANEFYNGSLGKIFIEDIRKRGSIMTEEDLKSYRAKWAAPISTRLSTGETLHTVGPPGSGALLAFLLNIFDGYAFGTWSFATLNATLTTYQRIIEAYKYAYALRNELADPAYVDMTDILRNLTSKLYAAEIRRRINDHKTSNDPKHYGALSAGSNADHGTAHISILDKNGDAVSVTSSLNLYFGSGIVSERTGILTSSSMDDFGLTSRKSYFGLSPSPKNCIEPGKHPLSSMSPSVLIDSRGDVRMVVGAAGGTRIPSAIAFVIARHLWINETIKEAIDAARIHHQLQPMTVSYEYGVQKSLIDGLRAMGHDLSRLHGRGSIVCAIVRVNGTIHANVDYRKGGAVYGLD